MIPFSIFLFAILVVAWMAAPGGEKQPAVEIEPAGLQPEAHIA